jgi:hypothetical protein
MAWTRSKESAVAIYYPFMQAGRAELPAQGPGDYRLVSYLGTLGEADLSSGPALDGDSRDMILSVLTLLGVNPDEMQQQQRDGTSSRLAWIEAAQAAALTPAIVFALDDEMARRCLLDLKEAVDLLTALRPDFEGGCLMQLIDPPAVKIG